ncbi:MAG: tetratricopeptide repeat protein [bacterium]|nr:tetratricopeptide repeat protein [bacterium]
MQSWKIGLGASLIILGAALFAGCQSTALTAAKLYVQQEDWDKAAIQLQTAVDEAPADAEAWMLLAIARANLGQFEASGQAFAHAVENPARQEEAARLRRGWWVKLYNSGVEALAQDDFEGAVAAFSAARAIDAGNVDGSRNLAYAYYQMDRAEEAITVYHDILAMNPDDEDTAVRLGYLYYNEEDFDNAAALLAGPASHSSDAQLLGALATSYQELGREEEALAVIQQTRSVGLASVNMLLELGRIYWAAKDFTQAEQAYGEAAALEPDNADANHNRAMALLELKRDDEALVVLERVVELDASLGDAWYWLGVVYARANRVSDSKAAFQRATDLGVE